jgi:Peptidase family S41
MTTDNKWTSITPLEKPKRRLWRRVLGWGITVIAVLFLVIAGMLERIAHRASPVHMTLTAAEIKAEDERLTDLGLILPNRTFLKQHPFEPPWTSHSLLVPSRWSEPPIKKLLGPRQVRADQLLLDLDVLEPVMERAYGGWDSAKARGWDWSQWFNDWRRRLTSKGTAEVSFNEAFAPVDALIAFQRDNHTQIPLSRQSTSDGSQTAVLASMPIGRCSEIRAGNGLFSIRPDDAGQQMRSAKLWNTGDKRFVDTNYISMPSSYGAPQALHCGDAWIPLHPIGRPTSADAISMLKGLWDEALSHDRASVERLDGGIVYARLPTFESRNYESVSQNDWAHPRLHDRVLIVDLRNNGGGSAEFGLNVLKSWVDERRMVPFDKVGAQVTSSCLSAPLKWTPAAPKQQMQELLYRIAKPYPPDCRRTVDMTPSQWTYLQHHFTPKPGELRIIALVNSRCGSDCELITAMLASLPETIVVGTNTFGICQLIQPGYSVLPHTGLNYRIATGRSDYYGDNRSVDGYGLDVDVVLPQVDKLSSKQLQELAEAVAKL